jgi:hypothetical protein
MAEEVEVIVDFDRPLSVPPGLIPLPVSDIASM